MSTPILGDSSSSARDIGASIGIAVAAERDVRAGPRDRRTEEAEKHETVPNSSRKEKEDKASMRLSVLLELFKKCCRNCEVFGLAGHLTCLNEAILIIVQINY